MKGDRLDRIIHRQYGSVNQKQMKSIYGALQQLNPKLRDPNRIYEGQILILPANLQQISVQYYEKVVKRTADSTLPNRDQMKIDQTMPAPLKMLQSSSAAKEEGAIVKQEAKEIVRTEQPPSPVQSLPRIEAIRQILRTLDGSLTSRGTYFLPLTRGGTLAIDCATVPVVELNDGSVVLLDMGKNIPQKTKKLIKTKGKRYAIIALSNEESVAMSLQKIFGASKDYRMTRRSQPVAIGENPQILLRADWQILHDKSSKQEASSVALNFLKEGEASLPAPVAAVGERQGWKILEINEKTGVISTAETKEAPDIMQILSSGTAIELVSSLLTYLGIPATHNTAIQVFQKEKDGFNLNVQIDLAADIQNRHILFHSKKIPQQLTNILNQKGFEVVALDPSQSKQAIVEKALLALNLWPANGMFSFPVTTTGRTRADVRFAATKISASNISCYLISFNFNPDLYPLIHKNGAVNIVRY